MKEDFLHFIWKYKLYSTELKTESGEELIIQSIGLHNLDSGPDFTNAKIKIVNQIWSGNVEIHINSSDWYKHKHQNDKAYDNVVLHVVYNHDREVMTSKGGVIPVLELKKFVSKDIIIAYEKLLNANSIILCKNNIDDVNEISWNFWKEKLLLNRLERKVNDILEINKNQSNDWNGTLYFLLLKYFGQNVNQIPFEILSNSLDSKILEKCKDDTKKIEALLFGQAGFLDESLNDKYPNDLQVEYKFLKHKYNLKSIDKSVWKFMRLRPANFPTIRIAQLCCILINFSDLFSKIIESNNVKNIQKLLKTDINIYWNTHYKFDVKSEPKNKELGKSTIDIIIINAILPLIFAYGKSKSDDELCQKSLDFYKEIKAEQNKKIKTWKELNILSKSAYDSQALLELINEYCSRKKCLQCEIGLNILKRNK